MSSLYSLKNNHTYTFTQDTIQIAQPFLKSFGIAHFDYSRVYYDQTSIVLTTNFDQYYSYIKQKFPFPGLLLVKDGAYLWDNYLPKKAIADNLDLYKLNRGIIIRNDYNNYIEFVDLAVGIEHQFKIENYFANMDIINQFIFYFKDKASKIIKECCTQKYTMPPPPCIKNTRSVCDKLTMANKLNIRKYYLHFAGKEIAFSKREYECISLLSKGKSMKETANILAISPRTVETYISKTKIKTNSFTTNKLIDEFIKNHYHIQTDQLNNLL